MPYKYTQHNWGSESFDWKMLQDAIDFICDYCQSHGLPIYGKEKWGNADIYPSFSQNSLLRFCQELIYKHAYKLALKKFNKVKWEIIGGMCHEWLLRDVLIKNGMQAPCKSADCWNGNHEFLRDGYCKSCFIHKEEEEPGAGYVSPV